MGLLIDDLLAFSRLGRQRIIKRQLDMNALAHEVIEEALVCSDRRDYQIEIDNLPQGYGDPALLRQVFANLVSNAIKYSGTVANPRIQIRASQEGREITYSIRNNGVGFSMDYAHKLFGVFQRLHGDDQFTGTGVGLAIVHRIVSRHGGRVWAQAVVNAGALFSFALPVQDVRE